MTVNYGDIGDWVPVQGYTELLKLSAKERDTLIAGK